MTQPAEVTDLGIERLVRIEERISGAEDTGLRARWEFGRELLAARVGGRLPNGYLKAVTERTGASRSELKFRMSFAERFTTSDELANAVSQFGSWHQIVNVALAKPADESERDGETSPLAVPDGQFATIVADPPWRYGNTSTRGAAEDHYPTMTIDELCELDIARERAAEQSHLYLWTTAGHLPEAFRVMGAWGFTYKTYLVWVKKKDGRPQMGMGNYFRVSTELVLFGVRGGMRTRDKATMNYFEQDRGKHSAKPSKFYDLVAKCSPGPYLEMFSRCWKGSQLVCSCSRCLRGWDVWGDQA